jgi:hypothetical protein
MNNNATPTPGVTAPGQQPALNLNQMIDQYVQLRDRKRLIESQHKEALKPYTDLMEQIEGVLLDMMQRGGVDSLNTAGGTAYQSLKKKATIKDGTAFRAFVIAQQKFELVDWKANANAVFDFITENKGTPPPGVNASSYVKVNVRRPTEEAEE